MSTIDKHFMTIRQTAEKYKAFSEGSLRWLWFNGEKNGFATCVFKCGKKILIEENLFVSWLQSGSTTGK